MVRINVVIFLIALIRINYVFAFDRNNVADSFYYYTKTTEKTSHTKKNVTMVNLGFSKLESNYITNDNYVYDINIYYRRNQFKYIGFNIDIGRHIANGNYLFNTVDFGVTLSYKNLIKTIYNEKIIYKQYNEKKQFIKQVIKNKKKSNNTNGFKLDLQRVQSISNEKYFYQKNMSGWSSKIYYEIELSNVFLTRLGFSYTKLSNDYYEYKGQSLFLGFGFLY